MNDDAEDSTASSSSATVALAPMAQQARASNAEDDWTGVTDPKERRRMQNRLAQRNWRKKIHQSRHFQHPPDGIVIQLVRLVHERFPPGRRCHLELPGAISRLTDFAQQAYQDYMLAAPRPTALQTLVQLNVLDALAQNAATLNITIESLCAENTLSPFAYNGPPRPDEASLPPSLQPTALQRTVSHHPWIDIFPLPEVRDSILRICGTAEEDELNIDLVDVEENDREKPNLVQRLNRACREPLGAWPSTQQEGIENRHRKSLLFVLGSYPENSDDSPSAKVSDTERQSKVISDGGPCVAKIGTCVILVDKDWNADAWDILGADQSGGTQPL